LNISINIFIAARESVITIRFIFVNKIFLSTNFNDEKIAVSLPVKKLIVKLFVNKSLKKIYK